MVRISVQTLHPTKKTPTPTILERVRRERVRRERVRRERVRRKKRENPLQREKIWVERVWLIRKERGVGDTRLFAFFSFYK